MCSKYRISCTESALYAALRVIIWDFFRIFLCHTHELSYCACLTRETERNSVFRDICAMADVMESLEAMDMEKFKLMNSETLKVYLSLRKLSVNGNFDTLAARYVAFHWY